jgi:probable O-glycosylation ligase (exosortase A-associated)
MLRTLLVFVIFVPWLFAAFRDRFAALLLYLWFALFRPQDWVWVDLTSLRLSLVLGLVLVIPCLLTGVLPDLRHPLGAGILAFLIIAILGGPFAITPEVTWDWVDYIGRLFLVLLLAIPLIKTRKRLLMTTAVIATSLGFHTVQAGLLFLLRGGVRFGDGLAGAFVDNNGYALATVMIIFLLVGSAQNIGVRWLRYGLFASAGVSVCTVVGTYSRGGFLALVASVLVFILIQRKRAFALVGLVGCALVVIIAIPLPKGYVARLRTIETYQEIGETSAISRTHFWRVAVAMALDHPLFGVGLRGYDSVYNRYDFLNGKYGRGRSVHSSHLQVLAEMGFPGMIVWMWLFANAYLTLFRVRARSRNPLVSGEESHFLFTMANAMIASITAFLVGGAFIALALNDLTWLTFVLVVALDRLSVEALSSRSSPLHSKAISRRKRLTVTKGVRQSRYSGRIEGKDAVSGGEIVTPQYDCPRAGSGSRGLTAGTRRPQVRRLGKWPAPRSKVKLGG